MNDVIVGPQNIRERPAWLRWWWISLLAGIVVVVAGIVFGEAIGFAGNPEAIETGDASVMNFTMLRTVAVCVLSLAAYAIHVRWIEGRDLSELSMRGGAFGGAVQEFAVGTLLCAAMISVVVGIMALFGGFTLTEINPVSVIWPAFMMGMYAGVTEEILMRGLLLRLSERWMGSWLALLLSSLIFGLLHFTNDNSGWLPSLAIAIEAGLLLGLAYMLTRRLWMVIAMHFSWNFVQGGI